MSLQSSFLAKIVSLFAKGNKKWVLLGFAALAALLSTMGIGGDVVSDIAQSFINSACSQ